jgi:allantoinase
MIRIKNGFLVKEGNELEEATIYFEDGKTKFIFPYRHTAFGVEKEIDVSGAVIMPGFIDPHVHFDDPGYTEREDFETGTRSAAAGGITTVIDMPCTSVPPVTSGENFDFKYNIVSKKAYVDFAFWGGVTPLQVESGEYKKTLRELYDRGIVGVKFYTISGMDSYPRMPVNLMDQAFRELKELGLVCGVHAEDFYLVDYYSNYLRKIHRTDPDSWAEGRVYGAEPVAIWTVASITQKVHNKLHVVHLSSKEGLNVVKWAKNESIDITAETCPHYLLFTSEDYKKIGAVLKTTPPLRSKIDRESLWKGIQDGLIDFVASDHAAAKYPEEKSKDDFWENYSGIPGTQLIIPILLTYGFHTSKITLHQIEEIMSENAAKRYGIYPRKGVIREGSDADFTIIDPNERWIVEPNDLESKGKYSIVAGYEMKGKIKKTIVRGEVLFDDGFGVLNKKGYGSFVKSGV